VTHATKTPAFRFIALVLAGALTAVAIPASANDREPIDQVPNWVSQNSFDAMNAYDIYEIDHAQKLGKRVIIEGYTAAESRNLVDEASNADTVASRTASFELRPSEPLGQHQGPRDR
jgi:hypothetical protein